ncbi:MAG: hypothetical protein SOY70_01980 [Veillonellaceae bacterium]|nr:hypothetical protein [Veillonellaceae bacterium]
MKETKIKHPEWLQVEMNGKHSYGYNQEWYYDGWQVVAGCGPTTATQVMSYIAFRDGLLDLSQQADGEAALKRMETMFNYVKPRYGGGVFKVDWLQHGLDKFCKERQLPYQAQALAIMPFMITNTVIKKAVSFVRAGLASDSPVAFLNRHRGEEKELYTWHWVPIVSMKETDDDVTCVVYDDERARTFSLLYWLKSTALGGGFSYLIKKD